MALTAKPVSAGLHNAVCYEVVDMGTHYDEKYDKHKHEIQLGWEIPEERITVERDGQDVDLPRAVWRRFTLSLHEKGNLRPFLEGWRGRPFTNEELDGFDLKNVLGAPCQLQVMHRNHDGKTYANVSSALPLPKGTQGAECENEPLWFAIEEGNPIPDSLPKWMQEYIAEAEEFKDQPEDQVVGSASDGTEYDEFDDDDNMPF